MQRVCPSQLAAFGRACILIFSYLTICFQVVLCSGDFTIRTTLQSTATFSKHDATTLQDTRTDHDHTYHTHEHSGLVTAVLEQHDERPVDNKAYSEDNTNTPATGSIKQERTVQPDIVSSTVSASFAEWKTVTSGREFDVTCGPGHNNTCSDPITTPSSLGQANVTSPVDAATETTPGWRVAMNAGMVGMACTGVVANSITFVTLTVNGRAFSRLTAVLLKHQALIDTAVCALAGVLFMQSSAWHVGQYTIDLVVCFLWHSQLVFWVIVLASIWNLVFIAGDRLMAVCFPIKYKTLSVKRLKIAIALLYIPCFSSTAPSISLVSFVDGYCVLGKSMSPEVAYRFYYWYTIFWLFVTYIFPLMSFVAFYGRIILQLQRHRRAVSSTANSLALTKSTVRITKCAITVTCIFVATISFGSIYFCLGHVGVMDYNLGAPEQLIGSLLTVCNSLANPFMYAIFLPAFRRSLWTTVCLRLNAVQDESTEATVGSTTA